MTAPGSSAAVRETGEAGACASFTSRGQPCSNRPIYDVNVPELGMGAAISMLCCKRHLPEWVDQAARGLERYDGELGEMVQVRRIPPIPQDAWDRFPREASRDV